MVDNPTTAMNLFFPQNKSDRIWSGILFIIKFGFFCAPVYAQFSRLLLLKKKKKDTVSILLWPSSINMIYQHNLKPEFPGSAAQVTLSGEARVEDRINR